MNWWDYFNTCKLDTDSKLLMNQYCGLDEIYSIPRKITLMRVEEKYGTPYIFCSWKIIIDDPTQIIDVEFYDYVNKNFYFSLFYIC